MTNLDVLACALLVPEAIIAAVVIFVVLANRNKPMPLDFAPLQSGLSSVSLAAASVASLAAASDDASNQAVLDGVTSSLSSIAGQLNALVPSVSVVSDAAQ